MRAKKESRCRDRTHACWVFRSLQSIQFRPEFVFSIKFWFNFHLCSNGCVEPWRLWWCCCCCCCWHHETLPIQAPKGALQKQSKKDLSNYNNIWLRNIKVDVADVLKMYCLLRIMVDQVWRDDRVCEMCNDRPQNTHTHTIHQNCRQLIFISSFIWFGNVQQNARTQHKRSPQCWDRKSITTKLPKLNRIDGINFGIAFFSIMLGIWAQCWVNPIDFIVHQKLIFEINCKYFDWIINSFFL